jgi:hypothetical protein
MKKTGVFVLALLLLVFLAPAARGEAVLYDWALNLNGALYGPTDVPPPGSSFNGTTATISYLAPAGGSYFFGLFVDHEIDEALNTFFNEYGSAAGAPPAGLSWEIDEPGYAFGNIFTNFAAGTLDNTTGVPAGAPDDVSMALGWSLVLAPGDRADIAFTIALTAPAAGFYLWQSDTESADNVYLSTTATITPGGATTVPESADWPLLLILGFAVVLGRRSLRWAHRWPSASV